MAGYARYELADKRAFSARGASALEDDRFRAAVAEKTFDGLVQVVTPELLIARPLLVPAISALAGPPPFRRVFERVLRARQRALLEGRSGFVFDLTRADGPVLEAIRSVSPRAARAIGPDLQLRLAVLEARSFEVVGVRVLADLARWWWPLLIGSLLCAAGCALLAGGLREALALLGGAVAGAGLIVAALVTAAGLLVESHAGTIGDDPDLARGALGALWDAFFSDLRSAALIAGLDGFSFTQDTPLGATQPSQLRCARFRGSADSPLFLVNPGSRPSRPRSPATSASGAAICDAGSVAAGGAAGSCRTWWRWTSTSAAVWWRWRAVSTPRLKSRAVTTGRDSGAG